MLRTSERCAPAYEQLRIDLRGAAEVAPDETGWRVGGRLAWLHAFVRILKLLDGDKRYEGVRAIAAEVGAIPMDIVQSIRRLIHAGYILLEEDEFRRPRGDLLVTGRRRYVPKPACRGRNRRRENISDFPL